MPVHPWTGPLHYSNDLIAGDPEEESEIMNEVKKDLGVDDRRSESSDTRSRSRSKSSDTREEGAKVKSKGGHYPNDLDFDSSDSDDDGGNGLKYYYIANKKKVEKVKAERNALREENAKLKKENERLWDKNEELKEEIYASRNRGANNKQERRKLKFKEVDSTSESVLFFQ